MAGFHCGDLVELDGERWGVEVTPASAGAVVSLCFTGRAATSTASATRTASAVPARAPGETQPPPASSGPPA